MLFRSRRSSDLDHLAEGFYPVFRKEHVLGTAEADTLRSKLSCLLRILRGIGLLFNMLSSLVITFLPRSKGLLISWLQSPSAVILEPKK